MVLEATHFKPVLSENYRQIFTNFAFFCPIPLIISLVDLSSVLARILISSWSNILTFWKVIARVRFLRTQWETLWNMPKKFLFNKLKGAVLINWLYDLNAQALVQGICIPYSGLLITWTAWEVFIIIHILVTMGKKAGYLVQRR